MRRGINHCREPCWDQEGILNVDCISDTIKFPECEHCIMVVKEQRRMPLLSGDGTYTHTIHRGQVSMLTISESGQVISRWISHYSHNFSEGLTCA